MLQKKVLEMENNCLDIKDFNLKTSRFYKLLDI